VPHLNKSLAHLKNHFYYEFLTGIVSINLREFYISLFIIMHCGYCLYHSRLLSFILPGMMFGAYIWGSFADARGRIPALILCQACNGLFIVGSSVSQSLWFLILMRFLSGLGLVSSLTMVLEL